jgi:hypothetical protein
MDTDTTPTCARHPRVETRISCVQCGTAICPDCMVAAPVGFKCPDCARQVRHARGLGRPDQYVRGVLFGVGATAVAALVLAQVFQFGFLSWIAAGVAGYLVAEAVRRGAGGNRADPFRYIAMGLAVATVAGAYLVLTRGDVGLVATLVGRNPLRLVPFLAAVYGAFRSTG